jgi:hypothetical protein
MMEHMIAVFNGTIGVIATLVLGTTVLNLSWMNLVQALLVSQVAGVIGLLLTLQAEGVPWIRRHILRRSVMTWSFFLLIYFGILLGANPVLRDAKTLAWLIVPIILNQGWCILIFGPIQDQIVRRKQRLAKLAAAQN